MNINLHTSIDKEDGGEQARNFGSISKFFADRTNGSKQLNKAQCLGYNDNPEGEKSCGIHLQS